MSCTKVGKYGTGEIVNCLLGKKLGDLRMPQNKSQVSYLMPAQTQPDISY